MQQTWTGLALGALLLSVLPAASGDEGKLRVVIIDGQNMNRARHSLLILPDGLEG